MNIRKQSQKGFVAVTLITVLSIATVVVIYAAILGSFPGGEVVVGGVGGAEIHYSLDNSTGWGSALNVSTVSTSWYARLNITSGDYEGPTNITWQLQEKTGPSTWTNASDAETTAVTLSGSIGQLIYVSSDGTQGTNYDWSTKVSGLGAGTYRVLAVVDSA